MQVTEQKKIREMMEPQNPQMQKIDFFMHSSYIILRGITKIFPCRAKLLYATKKEKTIRY